MKYISYLTVLIMISCSSSEQEKSRAFKEDFLFQKNDDKNIDSINNIEKDENLSLKDSTQNSYKNIQDVINEKELIILWMATDDYYPHFKFAECENCVFVRFDGKAVQEFNLKIKDDKIEILYKDSNQEITSFPDVKTKLKPKYGKPFMELELISENMMIVKHLYPQWTNEVNEIMKNYSHPYFVDTLVKIDIRKGSR
jgi:hypothetical protein